MSICYTVVMKRELFIHFAFWFSLFVFITLVKQNFTLNYWPFWIGGIIGTILPDIDHLIYIYLVKPYELTSQRFTALLQNKELKRSLELLYETRSERINLIFHSQFFQVVFLILTFWIMSSSGSIFGRGIALAFALHLAVDQLIDFYGLGRINNKNEKLTIIVGLVLTVIIGLI